MRAEGKPSPRMSFKHIFLSSLGGFLGILGIERLGNALSIGGTEQLFLIGSFGASAVLVYGVPRAEFSQPRNLFGGHVVSALVGVTLVQCFGTQYFWIGPLAVALAIFAMKVTRTVHPPGGATALIAVIGGQSIRELGFLYPFCPVALGSLIMITVAVLFNNLSRDQNRNYPSYWW